MKIGPNGTCAWCGELDYGGHEGCERNYYFVYGNRGIAYTFADESCGPEITRQVKCFKTEQERFESEEK